MQNKPGKCCPRRLRERLSQMNSHFGRGDIVRARFSPDSGTSGVATRKIPVSSACGFTENRRFRIEGHTLYFLGHQTDLRSAFKV